MKFLRYGVIGSEKPALLDGDGRVRDLSGRITDICGAVLLPSSLESLRSVDPTTLPEVGDTPRIGPCVGGVGKIVCVGLNYRDHAASNAAGSGIRARAAIILLRSDRGSSQRMRSQTLRISTYGSKWMGGVSSMGTRAR
jgi:hypothetical protein